jgi:MFS family permease
MNQEHPVVSPSETHSLLSIREQISLSFFWFALNLQSAALLPIVIPTQILLFVAPGTAGSAQQAVFLGWLSAVGAVIALVVQPIVGALSDRTRGRLGRRRPYIVAGALVLLVGMTMLGATTDVLMFISGFLLVHLGNNASTAAYQSLLPDRVPEQQRGAASGYMGLMTILGNVGSLALAAILLRQVGTGANYADAIRSGSAMFYALVSIVLVLGVAVTLLGIRETPVDEPPTWPPEEASGKRAAAAYQRVVELWIEPWHNHNFTWVFLTRAFVIMGLTLFLTFIEYYFARVAHVQDFAQATAALAVLALLGAVGSALVLGIISDRTHRVPVVCLATAFMALAALAFVLAPGSVPLWPLGIIFGLGYGAYTSVDWALAIDALPSLSAAGKDLGLWNIASTLPSILAPLLGSLVIVVADVLGQVALGYRIVFGCAALFLLLGTVFVLNVREGPREWQHPTEALGA